MHLGDALWAGLVAHARPLLVDRATASRWEAHERAAAAHQLAVWHLDRREFDDADRWCQQLNDDQVEHAIVVSMVDVALGRTAAARCRLHALRERRPNDPHLSLHLANMHFGTPELDAQRLHMFNEVLAAFAATPVTMSGTDMHPLRLTAADSDPIDGGLLVTVIVPVFNAEATVASALASVQRQTHRRLQILVVDDASTDRSADIVRELEAADDRITLISRDDNGGAYAARNAALERADGNFVTVHDADNWAHPQRIERQVRHLQLMPEATGNATHWVRADEHLFFQPHARHPYRILGKSTASLMVRTELFGVVGPWDHRARGAADLELLERLEARFGPVKHLWPHLPLQVSLRSPNSLIGSSSTGIRSLWHVNGVRRQYLEAFTTWHHDAQFPSDLPFTTSSRSSAFAVPPLLCGDAAESSAEVVVAADFTAGATSVRAALSDIDRAVTNGRSVALLHEPHSIDSLRKTIDPAVNLMLKRGQARLLSSGETVRCAELWRRGTGVLGGQLELAPQVIYDWTNEDSLLCS